MVNGRAQGLGRDDGRCALRCICTSRVVAAICRQHQDRTMHGRVDQPAHPVLDVGRGHP